MTMDLHTAARLFIEAVRLAEEARVSPAGAFYRGEFATADTLTRRDLRWFADRFDEALAEEAKP